jgi:hypothetical protein
MAKELKLSDNGQKFSPVNYQIISPEDLKRLRYNVAVVSREIPGAIFVGGTALRLWADYLGQPVPELFGGDTDITIEGNKDYEVNDATSAGWIDVLPYPKEGPFYKGIEYNNSLVKIATISHLLFYKLRSVKGRIDEKGTIMQKDVVYLGILDQMCQEDEWKNYLESVLASRPELDKNTLLTEINNVRQEITDCILKQRISGAVHPGDD